MMLGHWVNKLRDEDSQTFRGDGKLEPEQEEIKCSEPRLNNCKSHMKS
jgi:hypothetical protein